MKRMLFFLSVIALLQPINVAAQGKKTIKSVDLTMPVPTPDMTLEQAQEIQLTAAKTAFGDLVASGDIQIIEIDWKGDFNYNQRFKKGFPYKMHLNVYINPHTGFTTDYVIKDNGYYIDGTRISFTLNGKKLDVLPSGAFSIHLETTMTVGGSAESTERQSAQSLKTLYERNKRSYRASMKAYSIAEADAASPDVSPLDVIVINDSYKPNFNYNVPDDANTYGFKRCQRVTKVIIDTDDYLGVSFNSATFNIREVWLSDKVDVVAFIKALFSVRRLGDILGAKVDPAYSNVYRPDHTILMQTHRATLFIPQSAAAAVEALYSRPTWHHRILFTLRTYSGDVYAAQKAGTAAAKPFCTHHVFTARVLTAENSIRHSTCLENDAIYYTCQLCGECEHNDNHTWSLPHKVVHQYFARIANDEAYLGVNAAGQHVWWYSCTDCGKSHGYHQRHITKEDFRLSGSGGTYAQYKAAMEKMNKDYEEQALLQTKEAVGMFTLNRKSDAKMSPAFQSSVNFALNDNLLDETLLGDDYTVGLSYAQLQSLAVRLVKELTGKEVSASAIGLQKALGGKTLAADAAVSRQQMAAVFYRALRFIEESKVYCYTKYTSGLDKYTDVGSIASWAKEPMAFMEALGFLKGTAAKMLSPEQAVTIEEGIDLAERCTYAHQLGWYQTRTCGEATGERGFNGSVASYPGAGFAGTAYHSLAPGERVWVTGPRMGDTFKFLPIIDRHTGQTAYVDAEWYRPVRKYVFTSKQALVGPIEFVDNYE